MRDVLNEVKKDACMKQLMVYFFAFNLLTLSAQKRLNDIDLHRIPQKKVREFILQQQKNVYELREIKPSCLKGEDLSDLNELTYTYVIKDDIQTVWDQYFTTSPAESWNGEMISFGLLFSKRTNYIAYCDDHNFTCIDSGQVFYVNLGILGGIYNLAVGLEVTDVNEKDKYFQFSYLKEGKSKGLQTIKLTETDEGYTSIEHHTLFKSNSPFRDKILYPFFHKRAITEFHRNMEFIVLTNQRKLRSQNRIPGN